MKIIVTHQAPDLDAIGSVWLLKRFLKGWEDAEVRFVPAGQRLEGKYEKQGEAIETIDGIETIHVDTGMGVLDHHQTQDKETCAAKKAFDYILSQSNNSLESNPHKREAVRRLVDFIVDNDQFQEVYYPDPLSDLYEISLEGIIDGFKMLHPKEDLQCTKFVMDCLDAILHNFENRIWAEEEIKEKGKEFETRWGKALAVETQNDDVLKIAQKQGYVIVVRKDPNNGKLRIKARPVKREKYSQVDYKTLDEVSVDLTPVYEKLLLLDPHATWFLHVSKRMLLNGSSKNQTMRGTTVTLDQAIDILKNI